jgi:archaetidylinositol phosphate synthase
LTDIETHKRTNDILLGPLERPALRWLAAHMPAWMTPDILTAIGMVGTLIIFASYILTNISPIFLWLANFGLVVNWFGDSLDGTLARYRDIQRPRYGFFIDHTVDAVAECLIVLGLGLSPFVRFDLACLALICYLMLSVLVYIQQIVTNEFRISYGKLGPTEVRVIIILANTLLFIIGNPLVSLGSLQLSVYDIIVFVIIVIMIFIYFYQMISKGRELSHADRVATKMKDH